MNEQLSLVEQVVFNCKISKNTEDAKTFLNIASKYCQDLFSLDRIAYLQSEIKDYRGCVDNLKKCLSFATDNDSKRAVRANMAKMYNHLNEPAHSLAFSKLNANEQFDYDTLMEMSFSYYLMGNYTESEKMMRELITHEDLPDQVKGRVQYNLGSYDMERGEFKKGLKGFIDVGHRIGIWNNRYVSDIPVWNGENIEGKTILIHAEGGIGDEIINVRFVHNLKKLGANPVWVTNSKDLLEVFNRNDIKTIMFGDSIDLSNAVQIMGMYLPIILDLDENDVWSGPYLKPCGEYLEKWKNILPEGKKLAVKWSGNPYYDQDLHRSIPLDIIKKVKYNGTKVNLQLEPELYQDDMFNAGQYISNIEDTLALLWLCDDLITSCTSVAHMCGSMGKSGVVCPPIASYYVWLGTDGYSYWYDKSLKVVRQKNHKDWKFVEFVLD